ncbi:MAG: hypothetical protein KC912_17740 [Proteobacteria bacterium]|nr:hypothetical protein [Pseudomonadota bacterium]
MLAPLLVLLACGEPPVPPTPAEPPTPVAEAPEGCVLPDSLPANAVFGVSRTTIPKGADVERRAVELVSDRVNCGERVPCFSIEPEDAQALWTAFVDHDFGSMRSEPSRRSPHFGSRFLWVRWTDAECQVGESSRQAVDASQLDAFRELEGVMWEAARERRAAETEGAPDP